MTSPKKEVARPGLLLDTYFRILGIECLICIHVSLQRMQRPAVQPGMRTKTFDLHKLLPWKGIVMI